LIYLKRSNAGELLCLHGLFIGEKNKAEYSDAIKRACEEELARWEMRRREATLGASKGFTPHRMSFQMKNRFPGDWRDKHGVSSTSKVIVTVTIGEDAGSNHC